MGTALVWVGGVKKIIIWEKTFLVGPWLSPDRASAF